MDKLTIEITKDGITEKLFYNNKMYVKTYSKKEYGFMVNEKSWLYENTLPDWLTENLSIGVIDSNFLDDWNQNNLMEECEKEEDELL